MDPPQHARVLLSGTANNHAAILLVLEPQWTRRGRHDRATRTTARHRRRPSGRVPFRAGSVCPRVAREDGPTLHRTCQLPAKTDAGVASGSRMRARRVRRHGGRRFHPSHPGRAKRRRPVGCRPPPEQAPLEGVRPASCRNAPRGGDRAAGERVRPPAHVARGRPQHEPVRARRRIGERAARCDDTSDRATARAQSPWARPRLLLQSMWGLFGDRTPGPAGTYYYDNSTPVTYFWNVFDQVLLRPDLMHRLDALDVLSNDGDGSLLTPHGRPDRARGSDHLPLFFRLDFSGGHHGDARARP